MAVIRLIAGLGNPGLEYAETRHNAGFRFLDAVAGQYGGKMHVEARFIGRTGRCVIAGQDVLLLEPTTFMNESGNAVGRMARYYKIPADDILVVHDDLDLPVGVVRLKRGGGNGGHNGLGSIESVLGSSAFVRLRLGIGRPPPGRDVIRYVLNRASVDEERALFEAIARSMTELPAIVDGHIDQAMNRLHTNPDPSS